MPTKAVIYARYSSHNQREESIEGQLRECNAYADRHDFVVVGEYCDRALSGRTDKRPEFQRLLRDSAKGRFEAVIMYSMDRFSRNRYDSAMYKARFRRNGVKLYYVTQQIPDTPEGIIFESVMEGYAEYYSVNLARNIKRGLKENALHAKVIGRPCLGYKAGPDQQYEIDPVGAQAVREIFDLYASGLPMSKVIKAINDKGYRTANGAAFGKNSLYTILRNKKYTGTYVYDDVVIEDAIPPIVSKELYDKVQAKLEHNRVCKARAKAKEEYLLTTKLFCGQCGSPMIGDSGTSHTGTTYRYYKCNHNKRKRVCDMGAVRKEWIEELVVKTTVERVLVEDTIDMIAKRTVEIAEKSARENSLLTSLLQQQKDVQRRMDNLITAIEQGIITQTTKERLEKLEEENRSLESRIIREEMKRPSLTEDHVKYWLESFRFGNIKDDEYRRRIIDTLVNSVFVYNNNNSNKRIVITYNISGANKDVLLSSDIDSIAPSLRKSKRTSVFCCVKTSSLKNAPNHLLIK